MLTGRLAEIDDDLPASADETDTSPPTTRRLLWLEVTLVGLALWVAAAAFRPAFDNARTFIAPTAVAIVLSTGIATLAARRRVAARWAFVGSAAVAFLFVSYTILVGSLAGGVVPGSDTISGLRQGIGHGFSTMLGDALPLANHTLALVFVTLVCWFGATAATELTQRTSVPALPLLAPLAVFGLAMPVVAPHHPPSVWHVGAFIALCLLVVLVRAVPDPRATGTVIGPNVDGLAEFHSRSLLSSRLALGLPLIALCAVIAPLVGDAATTRDPWDPRDLREQEVEPVRVDDPLGEYKRIVNQTPVPAFNVRSDNVSITDLARVAIVRLDTYDGVRFTTSDRYQVAGPLLTSPEARTSTGRDATVTFSDLNLDDPWLPSAGTPTRIDLRGVGFDPRSGDLLAPGSVKGLEYQVRGRVVSPTPTELAAASLDTGSDADAYRALPGGLPPTLGRAANEITAGATTPGEALAKLATFFQTQFTVDRSSPAGHAAGRLDDFVNSTHAGSAEQFATAFTVMARSLGFPARVVVGYKLIADDKGTPKPLDSVYSNSYHVWSEVKFADYGWVTYDPTPSSGATVPARPPDTSTAPAVVTPQSSGQQTVPKELGPSEADPATDSASTWWRPVAVGAGIVAAVLALVLAVCGAIVATKLRRRRRRRTNGRAADRVVGAWDEVVDRLVELQFPITQSMTPRDIARATQATYGTAATLPLSFLVPDVGRAVYGRVEPDPHTVDQSWLRALEFEQNLAITLSRGQRWRARLSLRSLRARSIGV
jgi:transglutaminase-like putative cysteine protease